MSLQQHYQSIATTIEDYAPNRFAAPDPQHVERWAQAFDPAVRSTVVAEVDHVLARTYYSRSRVTDWLRGLVRDRRRVGSTLATFWANVNVLAIQTAGNSQHDLVALLAEVVLADVGVQIGSRATPTSPYLYLDDFLFSGGRIRNDLCGWIEHNAPASARLIVCVIGAHAYGQYDTDRKLAEKASAVGKRISIGWWYDVEVEDRRRYIADADVLRPTGPPDDAATNAYLAGLEPIWRPGNRVGGLGLFSSGAARDLLERQFLKVGVEVRRRCPHFDQWMRPLGRQFFKQPGFGTMYVTWRNCPNNAPLVLWAGDPWYPLFRRHNN